MVDLSGHWIPHHIGHRDLVVEKTPVRVPVAVVEVLRLLVSWLLGHLRLLLLCSGHRRLSMEPWSLLCMWRRAMTLRRRRRFSHLLAWLRVGKCWTWLLRH